MGDVITYIPLSNLLPGEFHPHLEFQADNLDNLINSIKSIGIIEPLIVRKKDEKYEIIIGNRRYNAAKSLNLEKIPAIIVNVNDEQALKMIITDNIQTKELSSKEEANLYAKALSYPNVNVEQLSITLGIPIDRINSKLKLIKNLITNNNQLIEKKPEIQLQTSNNNTINNDIISLTELNNEQIRRERLNMNENQAMPNMNNLQPNNNPEMNQQPTFGGRFFPSIDETKVGEMEQEKQTNMPNISSNEPLVNLTSLNNNQGSDSISIPTPNLEEPLPSVSNPIPAINIPNSPMPNMNIPNSEPIQPSNNNINPLPIPNEEKANIPEQITQPTMNINNESMPSIPNLNSNMNIPSDEPLIPNFSQESVVPIEDKIIAPNTNMEPVLNQDTPNSMLNDSKNIIPIVNIIKSVVSNMELMGYKFNVTENEALDKYIINIEVEK